jgi:hypothetical protein
MVVCNSEHKRRYAGESSIVCCHEHKFIKFKMQCFHLCHQEQKLTTTTKQA